MQRKYGSLKARKSVPPTVQLKRVQILVINLHSYIFPYFFHFIFNLGTNLEALFLAVLTEFR